MCGIPVARRMRVPDTGESRLGLQAKTDFLDVPQLILGWVIVVNDLILEAEMERTSVVWARPLFGVQGQFATVAIRPLELARLAFSLLRHGSVLPYRSLLSGIR
jgi:hypothetical protein